MRLLATFTVVLGSNILPAMSFLHVLLTIAFSFAFIWTWMILTLIHGWRSRMLVVDMAITLFFCRPAILMILAANIVALPRPRMSFLVFSQIARPLEDLLTFSAFLDFFDDR